MPAVGALVALDDVREVRDQVVDVFEGKGLSVEQAQRTILQSRGMAPAGASSTSGAISCAPMFFATSSGMIATAATPFG